jgi:hypothetical protein
VQAIAWRWTDNTGSSIPSVNRSGSIGMAAAVAVALLAGTGGVTSPSYFNQRQQRSRQGELNYANNGVAMDRQYRK